MAIPIELSAKIHNYDTRDEAMLEAAYYYIHASGFDTSALYALLSELPFLNDRELSEVNPIYQRVVTANSLLPQAKIFYSDMADALNHLESDEDQSEMMNAIKISHYGVMGAKTMASAMNLSEREVLAACARIGVQIAVRFLLHGKEEEKPYVKANLVYFAAIEALALGTRTDSYQYCQIDPQKVDPNLFVSLDLIRPIIKIRKEEEKKFFTQIVFGGTPVENRIITESESFYYLGENDNQERTDNPTEE